MLKGLVAALLARVLIGLGHPEGSPGSILLTLALVGGVASILGHVFTPWLRFRGGRGVATSLGVFLGIVPLPTLLAFALWGMLFALSKRVSVGSIGAALAYPFLVWALAGEESRTLVTVVTGAIAVLVLVRHIPNIKRILSGTEPPTMRARSPEGERS